ncbi:MAG TPA: FecR domain-containing protein [Flavisolibacter sp.]|nr:FecR domain-containing protein [Flavisolibacter sp.]
MSPNFYHITDDLLVKYMLGEANAEEQALVEEWLSDDMANARQYNDFKTIWEESRKLATISTVDENGAWERFKNSVQAPKQKETDVKTMRPLALMRIAALFILIVGGAVLGYQMFRDKRVENLVVASQKAPLIDTLPDGSVVTLNKHSSINYPSKFKGDTRTIALKGEAFFNVTPNKKKPFIIHVNDVSIRVVGTSFNVRSEGGVTEVIVETGRVQVTRNNKTVELKPEEKLKIEQQDSVMVKEEVKDKLYNYYHSKEFVCYEAPLWKLAEALSKAYEVNIVIETEALRRLKLTTTFNNESLDKILEVISQTFDIQVIQDKETNRIILK